MVVYNFDREFCSIFVDIFGNSNIDLYEMINICKLIMIEFKAYTTLISGKPFNIHLYSSSTEKTAKNFIHLFFR